MRQHASRWPAIATASSRVARQPAIAVPAPQRGAAFSPGVGYDFSRVPVRNDPPMRIQAKLTVGQTDDPLEREADRIADQVMRMPEPRRASAGARHQPVQNGSGTVQTRSLQPPNSTAVDAPPIVGDVLSSPGRPLEPKARAFFESRFGCDFSDVRVHTDRRAADAARSIGARAFTSGRRIAFAHGEYAPDMESGRRLVTHELAHVLQQQTSDRGPIRRQTPPPPTVQPQAGQPQAQPQASPSSPESYNLSGFKLKPPPETFTLQQAKDFADSRAKENPPAMTKASLKNPPTDPEVQMFMWFTLASVASRKLWGTESDLITSVAWVREKPSDPKAKPPPPVGTVLGELTVRFDSSGAGEVEFVSMAPVEAPTAFTDPGAAKSGLVAAYGLKAVSDGDATWTLKELNILAAALARIPTDDKGALKGVDIRRVVDLGPKEAAHFSWSTDVRSGGTPATLKAEIAISNSVFANDDIQFVGDSTAQLPPSVRTIIHEVGHSVEKRRYRETAEADANALAAKNLAAKRYTESAAPDRTARWTAYQSATKTRNFTEAAIPKNLIPKADVAKAMTEMKQLGAAAGTALGAAQGALKGWKPEELTESAAYRQAVDDLQKAIKGYATEVEAGTAKPEDGDKAIDDAASKRDAERDKLAKAASANPAPAQYQPVETAQTAWATAVKTQARLPKRTKRLQNFIDFVNANGIVPFTDYAKKNWPFLPDEFYAEAYSLWLTDREYLKANAPLLLQWFDAGHHRD
ncbi:MAG TPA: DUF4157 domain-containing protein [Rhizomicrobium sp.]|jgi:hypothetical protein